MLLLAAKVAALVWSNSPWSDSYQALWRRGVAAPCRLGAVDEPRVLGQRRPDGAVLYVIGLEVRREFSVGELTNPRHAAIPVAAAIGGLTLPALLYLLIAPGGAAANGGAW